MNGDWRFFWASIRYDAGHPPLDYVLARAWEGLHPADWFRKIPVVLYGTATVGMYGALIGRRAGTAAGLVSAVFLAFARSTFATRKSCDPTRSLSFSSVCRCFVSTGIWSDQGGANSCATFAACLERLYGLHPSDTAVRGRLRAPRGRCGWGRTHEARECTPRAVDEPVVSSLALGRLSAVVAVRSKTASRRLTDWLASPSSVRARDRPDSGVLLFRSRRELSAPSSRLCPSRSCRGWIHPGVAKPRQAVSRRLGLARSGDHRDPLAPPSSLGRRADLSSRGDRSSRARGALPIVARLFPWERARRRPPYCWPPF